MAEVNLDLVLGDVAEIEAQVRRELPKARVAPLCAEELLGCRFLPGARVRDLVTGMEGDVELGTKVHLVVAPAER